MTPNCFIKCIGRGNLLPYTAHFVSTEVTTAMLFPKELF